MFFYILLLAAVALLINYIIANAFQRIAEDKGYPERSYFLFCFFLGVAGYIMVCALPDRAKVEYHYQGENRTVNTSATPAVPSVQKQKPVTNPTRNTPTPPKASTWICGNCGASNSTNYSQCKKCGSFRS